MLAAVLGAAVLLLPILVGWYAPAGECEGLLALPWWFTPLALLFSIGIPFLAAALRLDTDPERLACDSPSATDLGDGLVRFSDGSVCLTRDGVAASIQSDGDNDWTDAEVIALAREFQPSTVEWLLEQDR